MKTLFAPLNQWPSGRWPILLFLLLALALPFSGISQTQIGASLYGNRSDDFFGYHVSVSANGQRIAIGAPVRLSGLKAGYVKVYDLINGSWVQVGADIPGENGGDNSGWSVSLSGDGTRLAIGAQTADGANGNNTGHVRVYSFNGQSWSQLGSDIDGEAVGDRFGSAVALSTDGTTLAVGGPSNDGNGNRSGHVRVFQFNGSDWVQLGNDLDGEAAEDQAGTAVSLSADGTILAVGAYLNDGETPCAEREASWGECLEDYGHVRVYEYVNGAWQQIGSDINGTDLSGRFGWSVSLSDDGTQVAIGASSEDATDTNSGSVRVYAWSNGSWSQKGGDLDGEGNGYEAGRAVSLSADGNLLAVGATGGGGFRGHAYLYQWNGSGWDLLGSKIRGFYIGERFGNSVALSGDGSTLIAGGPEHQGPDGFSYRSGWAQVYAVPMITNWSSAGDGTWNAGANWSSGQAPDSSTDAVIDGNVTVTVSGVAEAASITMTNGADLVVNGSLTVPNVNDISIPANSKLSGSGTINGDVVNNGGNICMGNSPGILTVNGDATHTTGTIDVEINGSTPGTEYDQLAVSGTFAIGAGAALHIVFGDGFLPAPNDLFELITATSIDGDYDPGNVAFSGGNVTGVSIEYFTRPGGYLAVMLRVTSVQTSSVPDPCTQDTLTLTTGNLEEGIYQAIDQVTSNLTVNPDDSVRFLAGTSVQLSPGFQAAPSAAGFFRAAIETCPDPQFARPEPGRLLPSPDFPGDFRLRISPNPFGTSALLEWYLPEPQPVSIQFSTALVSCNGASWPMPCCPQASIS